MKKNISTLTAISSKEYKDLAKTITISYGYGETPFGEALIAFTDKGVCYLAFIDENKEEIFNALCKLWENAKFHLDEKSAKEYLENIFLKNKKHSLFVKGTELQISVWKTLLALPYGVVTSYQEIANTLLKPNATRAIASAIGKNHIAYLIPCHRVIAKSGAMSGYRWGIERKKMLIADEAVKKSGV